MKAIDQIHICPYTGLRSFTEEESLYFKGRDLQTDQITALLEQNKFLMVTGASGEGKSSLIYGGLIPNARAGFFKAKYTNWVIADFRPERNPVGNMANALAGHFGSSPATIETELRRGYSSLIDVYTNSSFYAGEDDGSWNELTDDEKKTRKRKAANLLIIVDQFEEFFTNPENFYNESPSNDSQIVVNLVLETARIAIKKNLPVYVVCTMRSDYIGQCSAFRGLPEYIGFSQFFVPRLKRKDLKQVIEEPAILSGNRISQRLIERLVFDISDGVDQLPILQHALSRIWEAADRGAEEMDLLHYAMVGGMPADDLPDEDISRFRKWFSTLPENQQALYKDTGLQKIIEIHANILYENAWEYYNKQHPENPITQQEAKRVIAITFSCLTKIDNSRAVRNRMNLEEITEIINRPKLSSDVVGEVLNIFREEGNSFIRPFSTEDRASHKLLQGTVLDITHESLIRNWNKLNQWANKEFEYFSTFQDFQKQLDRWKKSGKSSGYLLPIGPLTYFENWYNNCKPNIGWIRRYAETKEDRQQTVLESAAVLADTKEFLHKSARKEMVTRAFMKYGPKKIATIAAILIMLGLTGFYWYNAEQKKNENVIQRIKKESSALMKSKEVGAEDKALYLLTEERLDSGTLIRNLEKMDYKDRLTIGNETYKQLLTVEKNVELGVKSGLSSLLSKNLVNPDSSATPELLLTEGNKFIILMAMDQYYLPDKKKEEIISAITDKNYDLSVRFLKDTSLYQPKIPVQLNVAIQYWITIGKATNEKISKMLSFMSPLAGKEGAAIFNKYYAKGNFESNGRFANDFNGGYHSLASLYAANGDTAGISWCFRSLLENNQRNYLELGRILNSHLNIIGYLYQFGHRDKVPGLMNWIATNTKDNPPQTLLRNMVLRSGYISHLYTINYELNFFRATQGYFFPNLYFCDRSVFDAILEDYESSLRQIKDPADRDFQLAMNYKRKAMFYHKYWYDRKMPVDEARLNNWLKAAVDLYATIDTGYLEAKQSSSIIYNTDGIRTSEVKRKNLFIYPDYRDGWFAQAFHSDYFFNFLKKNGQLSSHYKTGDDLQAIHFWVAKAFEWKVQLSPKVYANDYPVPDKTLQDIISFVDSHPEGMEFDRNLIRLILANHAFERGDTMEGMKQYELLEKQKLLSSSNRYEYLEKNFFLNMMNQLAVNLAANGKMSEAVLMNGKFEDDREKALCYLYMARKLYKADANPYAFNFLDSAYAITKKINYAIDLNKVDPRYAQIQLLYEIGGKDINKQAADILRDLPEFGRYLGVLLRVSGIAQEGNYYMALTAIPNSQTEFQDLECRANILKEAAKTRERATGNTQWKTLDESRDWGNNFIDFQLD